MLNSAWDAPVPFGVQGHGGQINFMKFWKKVFRAKNKKGGVDRKGHWDYTDYLATR